jgi:DNA-directed RNA polymerase III subunit RPC1
MISIIQITIYFQDIPLLMVRSDNKLQNPINVLLTRIVVPPVCIRPSVVSDLKSGTTEDDITMKLSEIVLVNEAIRKHNREGQPMRMLVDQWDMLQVNS